MKGFCNFQKILLHYSRLNTQCTRVQLRIANQQVNKQFRCCSMISSLQYFTFSKTNLLGFIDLLDSNYSQDFNSIRSGELEQKNDSCLIDIVLIFNINLSLMKSCCYQLELVNEFSNIIIPTMLQKQKIV